MPADRAQLEAWIAQTRRTQQRLYKVLLPSGIVALGLLVWSRPIGGVACAIVGMFALFGTWITNGHINDWEQQIDKIDHPPPPQMVGGRLRRERD